MVKLRCDGARWIFADRRATPVSTELGRYAQLRFANSEVRVYVLDERHGRRHPVGLASA